MLCYAKSLQSCPTLCDPIDGSPPGSTIPGILQARTLEWVAISFRNILYSIKSLNQPKKGHVKGILIYLQLKMGGWNKSIQCIMSSTGATFKLCVCFLHCGLVHAKRNLSLSVSVLHLDIQDPSDLMAQKWLCWPPGSHMCPGYRLKSCAISFLTSSLSTLLLPLEGRAG